MRDDTESGWPWAAFGLTCLIGRQTEADELGRLLHDSRLVTMVGAPGAGKTRLAAEVAQAAARSFRGGLRPVSLAPVRSPVMPTPSGASVPDDLVTDDLVTELAAALGVRNDGDSRLPDALVDALRTAEVLILLDNCEHVVRRLAGLVARILANAPRVRVLATSRVPLGIPGERLYRVLPLNRTDAVELFLARAGLVADLVLDEVGRRYVEQICQRLDGLPLAIELAARQARALSLRELLERLDTELPRMEVPSSPRTAAAPAVEGTMAATIASSCRLLSAEQNELFEQLSVFAGRIDFPAVEAVAGPGSRPLAELTTLVDHSLVVAEPAGSGELRYRMLEPVRQYAAARLDDRGEADLISGRHARHYLDLARVMSRGLMSVRGPHWYDALRHAEGNVLAAVAWARRSDPPLALRLVTCLAGYWEQRGYVNEARDRLEGLLEAGSSEPRTRAEALLELCQLGYRQGRYEQALPYADEALAIMRELGDDDGLGRGLRAVAQLAGAAGDTARALQASERSVRIFRALGDPLAEAWSSTVLAFAHYVAGDIDLGARAHTFALRALDATPEAPGLSYRARVGLSFAAACRGDIAVHRQHLEGAIADLRLLGALDGDNEWMWSAVSLAYAEGRANSTLRLAGAARALGRQGKVMPPTADLLGRQATAAAEARVGPREAARLLATGAGMTIEQVVAEATNAAAGNPTPTADSAPLSARELEVARLTGQGMSNADIAERLVISRRTVESHQEHIREKLRLSSRYEVMAWALATQSV